MRLSATTFLKIRNFSMLIGAVLVLSSYSSEVLAQAEMTCETIEGVRTCVVEPGFGTLNQAVAGDTMATGERVDPNTVYVLQRDELYLMNGALENQGYHLRVVAEEGEGHPPIVQPGVTEAGTSDRPFSVRGDLTVRGLYITNLDDAGSLLNNMFRIRSDSVRVEVDDSFLEYDGQSFFRFDGANIKLFLTDSHIRNSSFPTVPSNGRIFDTRGNTPDTIWVENNTMYQFTHDLIRDGGGIINFLHFDHNTVYQGGEGFDITRAIEAHITNNLFVNPGVLPDIDSGTPEDSLQSPYFTLDSLSVPEMTEEDRNIVIQNNNFVYTQPWLDFYATADSLNVRPMLNSRGERFVATNPNIVVENNIEEVIAFTDAPAEDDLIAFWTDRITNPTNENPPEFWADKNGTFDMSGLPAVGIGELPFDFDFTYPVEAESYAASEGGFPLGDLNWFPEQKEAWIAWKQTGTDVDDDVELPTGFTLHGNYPNPFNPTTTIRFDLPATAAVTVEIFDLLGRKVLTVPVQQLQAGANQAIRIDAASLTSGVYLYRVNARVTGGVNYNATGRMVLLK